PPAHLARDDHVGSNRPVGPVLLSGAGRHEQRVEPVPEPGCHLRFGEFIEEDGLRHHGPPVETTGSTGSSPEPGGSGWKQAARWSAPRDSSGGTDCQQISVCRKQRAAKRHCGGGSIGLGMSPLRMIRSRRSARSSIGIAESSALVYGCLGLSKSSSARASSTSLPRYMTAIRSARCRTTVRSWEMKR